MQKFNRRDQPEGFSDADQKHNLPGAKNGRSGGDANEGDLSSHARELAILAAIIILLGAVVALLLRDRLGVANLLSDAQRLVRADKKAAWREVVAEDAGFSIQLPDEPIRSLKTITTEGAVGNIPVRCWEVRTEGKNGYAVLYYDIPEKFTRRTDVNALFKRITDVGVADLKGRLVQEKFLSLGPWMGKEIHVENESDAFKALMFLVDGRFYHLIAYQKREKILSNDVELFLASFRVKTPSGQVVGPRDPVAVRWEEFSHADGRFTVDMPGTPVATQEAVSTSGGGMIVHRFSVNRTELKEVLSVQYADYPAKLLKKMKTSGTILNNAGSADVENFKGTLVSQKTLTGHPYPGTELHIESADAGMRLRMYLVNGRLYKLSVVGPKDVLFIADDDRFLDSLTITAR